MSRKIPEDKLILHIKNVLNCCVLSSVTAFKLRQYLKHKFKDALPCDGELDVILEKAHRQFLNSSSVAPVESNNETSSSSSNGNEIRDKNFQVPKIYKKRILHEKRIFKRLLYRLKRGKKKRGRKYIDAVEVPPVSEGPTLFKPLLTKNWEEDEKKASRVAKRSVKGKAVPTPRKRKAAPKKNIKTAQPIKCYMVKGNTTKGKRGRKPANQKAVPTPRKGKAKKVQPIKLILAVSTQKKRKAAPKKNIRTAQPTKCYVVKEKKETKGKPLSKPIKTKASDRFSLRKSHEENMEYLREQYPSITSEQLEIILISSSDSKEVVLQCKKLTESS